MKFEKIAMISSPQHARSTAFSTKLDSTLDWLSNDADDESKSAFVDKLNELIASQRAASNRLVAVEDLDERELVALRAFYCRIAELAKQGRGLHESHSLDEADQVHQLKSRAQG